MASVDETMKCDCPVLSKIKDGSRVRYCSKSGKMWETGTLDFVWLSLDCWSACIRRSDGTTVEMMPEFGDRVEVI